MDNFKTVLTEEQETKLAIKARIFLGIMALFFMILGSYLYLTTPVGEFRHNVSYFLAVLSIILLLVVKIAGNKMILRVQDFFILWP